MEMLLDLAETHILSHADWGDDYRWLWRYDIATAREEKIEHFSDGFSTVIARDWGSRRVVQIART